MPMDAGALSYRRYLDGDDEALVEIIRDYKDGLMLFINRYVHNIDIAEELCEDTFFKLVTRKPRFTEKYSFKTWLYTIGRNTAINYLRRRSFSQELFCEIPDNEAQLELEYLKTERRMAIHTALKALNEDHAKVLYLSYFESLSNAEIAHVMSKNTRQIENLLYRAKIAMKKELIKEGFSYEDI